MIAPKEQYNRKLLFPPILKEPSKQMITITVFSISFFLLLQNSNNYQPHENVT
jgi:hypothetical protein